MQAYFSLDDLHVKFFCFPSIRPEPCGTPRTCFCRHYHAITFGYLISVDVFVVTHDDIALLLFRLFTTNGNSNIHISGEPGFPSRSRRPRCAYLFADAQTIAISLMMIALELVVGLPGLAVLQVLLQHCHTTPFSSFQMVVQHMSPQHRQFPRTRSAQGQQLPFPPPATEQRSSRLFRRLFFSSPSGEATPSV